jgi:hypothetical protein
MSMHCWHQTITSDCSALAALSQLCLQDGSGDVSGLLLAYHTHQASELAASIGLRITELSF